MIQPGEDVLVDFDGGVFPGQVLKLESSGYVLCRLLIDPAWDFGKSSGRVDPEQVVAVRQGCVRKA